MIITTGNYSGFICKAESNIYQNPLVYPEEWANRYHVILDAAELDIVP